MKRIALFTFIMLMAAGLYAQIPKISTQPGCKNYRVGEKHLPNVPACRKTFHTPPLALSSVVSGGVTPSTVNFVDSFYLNDSKGFLLACKTHNLDTNTFVGCRLAEGRTLDELLNAMLKESAAFERLYDKERKP
jgi:hypothetical protein